MGKNGVRSFDIFIYTYNRIGSLGFLSASRDEYSLAAVTYGHLLTERERGDYQRQGITRDELAPLDLIAGERYAKVDAAAKKLLAENPNYQKIMDALDEDFNAGGLRVRDALLHYNNNVMDIVKHYFPMHRTEAVSSNTTDAGEVKKLMGSSAGGFNLFVEKGFVNGRTEIPPQYQTNIKLDILGVWAEAVNKEEHFIAYGQAVKDLNAIYKQNRQVKDAIQRRYGQDAVNHINKYINELTNPTTDKTMEALDGFIKTMRGNAAAAYLSFNVTSIVKQGITSPAPFFGYMNPFEYWAACVKFAKNYNKTWQEIKELSPYMKHRSANIMVELVKEKARHAENKVDAAIGKISDKGMVGLEIIDRLSVAPGWLVLFRKEQQRLTNDPATANMSEKDIRVKAAQYADDIVSITQPSGLAMDVPQLFKGNSELGKAFLQFTQSLSNIWQMYRYDLPLMVRERNIKGSIGMTMGFSIAGILLGAITAGFDDDDDETAKMKKRVWWATTQFTDAFPVIGSDVTRLAEQVITGETSSYSGNNLIPAFDKARYALQTGLKAFQQKDFDENFKKAAQAALEAFAIGKGLPVSGSKKIA